MSLPALLTPGAVIGEHYIINDLINSGGFGAVYRGIDTSTGNRTCAVKEIYNVTPVTRRQALMEVSVLLTVRSPHLPDVYDALEANGRFYLIMELIEGQNLLQLLRSRVPGGVVGEQDPSQPTQGPCSEQEVLSWLLPILDVLQELHSRRPPIMHRDIKPGNIILKPDQTAVLVDFGLTKLYDPSRDTQTILKAVSEGFSPAEQYVGRTSPQSDIYSMAATMYLLLTNRRPPMAIHRTVKDALIPPRQLNPRLSPHIEAALLKALSVNASERFQSAGEFLQALRDPAFRGYAPAGDPYSDSTVAAPVMDTQQGQQQGQQRPITLPAPPQAQNNGAHSKRKPAGTQKPPMSYQGAPLPPNPYQGPWPNQAYPPAPGYGMAPQMMMPHGPLPTATNQGCLCGALQGVLAGLLIVFTSQVVNFYVAILFGFGFYLLAGWLTTRKGGSSWRGLQAGFWSGLFSAIVFGVTFGVGYVILLSQRLRIESAEMPGAPGNAIFKAATDSIHTAFPPSSNVLALIIVGIIVASLLGLAGGFLGTSSFKTRMAAQRNQPSPHP
ncbi:MAG TPA: serine/threonine-protein kinase [Ktedonobacteraceae bacterium]